MEAAGAAEAAGTAAFRQVIMPPKTAGAGVEGAGALAQRADLDVVSARRRQPTGQEVCFDAMAARARGDILFYSIHFIIQGSARMYVHGKKNAQKSMDNPWIFVDNPWISMDNPWILWIIHG